MMTYALILLLLAALLGFTMIVIGLRYHRSSLKLVLAHIAFAVAGLAMLFAQIMQYPANKFHNSAALLLTLTLVGGLLMFALRDGKRAMPLPVVGFHAGVALVGIFVLWLG